MRGCKGANLRLIFWQWQSTAEDALTHGVSVKSRARAAVVLFHLEPNRVQVTMLACTRTLWLSKELLFPNLPQHCSTISKACKLSLLVLKTVPSNSKQNKSLLLPTSKSLQRTYWRTHGMSCKQSAKVSLHIMASNSQRGLPQRLSQKCLALIIPKSNKLLQRITSSCQKLGKIKKHQNNSQTTQVNSELLKVQTATGQLTKRRQLLVRSEQKSRHYWAFRSKLNGWVKLKCHGP